MNQIKKIEQLPKKIVIENIADDYSHTYERYLTNGGTFYKDFFEHISHRGLPQYGSNLRLIDDEMTVGQVIREVKERLARGCVIKRIVK